MLNLEQSETLALNLEQAAQDKVALQKRLQDSLEKEGKLYVRRKKSQSSALLYCFVFYLFFFSYFSIAEEQMRKVGNLEELLKRLEYSVTKLEAENANLRRSDKIESVTRKVIKEATGVKFAPRPEEMEKLQQQLQALKGEVTAERQAVRQAQSTLWKKEKELSDANLDKRIATRASNKAEEKIKVLQEEKQKLQERLTNKAKEEEESSKKLLKELEIAKASLNDVTRDASRNKMQADSAQRVPFAKTYLLSLL